MPPSGRNRMQAAIAAPVAAQSRGRLPPHRRASSRSERQPPRIESKRGKENLQRFREHGSGIVRQERTQCRQNKSDSRRPFGNRRRARSATIRHVTRSSRICVSSAALKLPSPNSQKIAARNAGYPGKRVSVGTICVTDGAVASGRRCRAAASWWPGRHRRASHP